MTADHIRTGVTYNTGCSLTAHLPVEENNVFAVLSHDLLSFLPHSVLNCPEI